MTFSLEQLSQAYPQQLWLEFSQQQQKKALPVLEDYSHDAARFRAGINCLVINTLVSLLQEEANLKSLPISFERMKNIWEFVNGTGVDFGDFRIVIIPSIESDTEEFCVPQEWVDIPELAADYYLAVQVNLEDKWLRVWGFTTHRKLKKQGRYDASDRTYSLDKEDLFENLNVLWVSQELCREEKAFIEPLPSLSPSQIERFLTQLGQPSLYSPRLKIPFAYWGAILASDNLRQQLYQRRLGKIPVLATMVNLTQNIFPQIWQSVEELVLTLNLNLAIPRSGSRSGDGKDRPSSISRGRVIDLGIQLAGHPVALLVYFTPEQNNKWNIVLQVHPGSGHPYLPPLLQLIVLDDTGAVFLEAQARKADNWIQLEFRGEIGEQFRVKVALGDASITEDFVI